jgi:mycoredoxin-dependent peroxiredoxin
MAVEVDDAAPDFELRDQHGTPVRLSSFRGTRNVVLVFYPLAFSGVCSAELVALRDRFPEASRDDVELLTVSVDSTFALRTWSDQEKFGFAMLSDFWPHGAVARAYGVFDENFGAAVRGTFIIDKSGVVRWRVVNPVPQARDVTDYQNALAALA